MHCASRLANLNFVWHETFKNQDLLSSSFFITIGSSTYILIRLCKYVPCLPFYSFPVLFCIYSVYICKISRLKLTSTRRDGALFEKLECVHMARYQGQNEKGPPFVMNWISRLCRLILQTYVIFQLELWIKVTFGHHCTIKMSVTLRHYSKNKMFPWHFILLKKKSLPFLNSK